MFKNKNSFFVLLVSIFSIISLCAVLISTNKALAVDTDSPEITNLKIEAVNNLGSTNYNPDNTFKISWDTDLKTNGKVEYGLDKGIYPNEISDVNTNSLSHSIILANLEFDTPYYFRISSTNNSSTVNIEKEMRTMPKELKILKVDIVDIGSDMAIIHIKMSHFGVPIIKYGTESSIYLYESANVLRGYNSRKLSAITSDSNKDVYYVMPSLNDNTKYYFIVKAFYLYYDSNTNSMQKIETTYDAESSFKTKEPSRITSITPTRSTSGSILTIKGKNFGNPLFDLKRNKYALTALDFPNTGQELLVTINCIYKPGLFSNSRLKKGCTNELISWSDSEIKLMAPKNSGKVRIYNLFKYDSIIFTNNYTSANFNDDEKFEYFSLASGPKFSYDTSIIPSVVIDFGGATQCFFSASNLAPKAVSKKDFIVKINWTFEKFWAPYNSKNTEMWEKKAWMTDYFENIFRNYIKYFNRLPYCYELQNHFDKKESKEVVKTWLKAYKPKK